MPLIYFYSLNNPDVIEKPLQDTIDPIFLHCIHGIARGWSNIGVENSLYPGHAPTRVIALMFSESKRATELLPLFLLKYHDSCVMVCRNNEFHMNFFSKFFKDHDTPIFYIDSYQYPADYDL